MVKRVAWWVVFEDVALDTPARWWLRWLRPGYRHCWAFRDSAHPGGLLLVHLTVARLEVEDVPGLTAEAFKTWHEAKGAVVLPMVTDIDDSRWSPRILTCVGVVRALAGKRWRGHTPYRLARELARRRI